jgi:ribonuclease D
MPALTSTRPVLINTFTEMVKIISDLEGCSSISVDTESNSLYVYREQVCLLQISTPDADYLIDTLAVKDISPLAGIFANPKLEKIFHASEYDVICLKRDFGFEFANLFDTMIAARILGEKAIGLASLLKSRLGLELDKKYQRANWGIRPLPKAMLEYASQDSHYLFQLRDILEQELKDKNLLDLAHEDFRLACQVPAHTANPNQNSCWKVAGAAPITPQEAAILHEICAYREKEASRINLPPFKVLSNEIMVHLAQAHPVSIDEVAAVKGMSEKLVNRHGSALLAAVQRGETAPPIRRPKKARPDEQFLNRFNALREWRKIKGRELKVESDVVLPRDYVEIIASGNPTTLTDLAVFMKDIPYRSNHFGREILKVLKGVNQS